MLHRLFLSLTLLSVLVFPTCLSASEFPVENQLPLPSPASPTASQPVVVNLRIEGSQYTIFEGVVQTHSHNVTTELGGNHRCDGTNFRAHPDPVPATFTAALDDASKAHGFTFDGTYWPRDDDFYIICIADEPQNVPARVFWNVYLNFAYNQVGGCQLEIKSNDNLLWALGQNGDKIALLKLDGPRTARVGQPVTLTVTNGRDGAPVAGADVNGHTTDAHGHVAITFTKSGVNTVKANKSDTVRSNRLDIKVT